MKKINYLAFLLILGILATGCKDDAPPAPSAEEVQTGLLAKTWLVGTTANSVTFEGTDENGNWDGFTVTFAANGTYTASNVSAGREVVWPSTGTWAYKGAGTEDVNVNTLERGDGVEIAIVVDEASLKMTFTYTDPGGRTDGTEGPWVFNMGL